ncbi:MAG: DNA adenine methylase [Pseudomonadota bacterium]
MATENHEKASKPLLADSEGQTLSANPWRPIHYLGSKLRLIYPITSILDELDPERGAVCDLFAGSGTVASSLSQTRSVVASDIQEFARTICAALLETSPIADGSDQVLANAREIHRRISRQLGPLVELETEAIRSAEHDPELLCNIVDDGSLLSDEMGNANNSLAKAKKDVLKRIRQSDSGDILIATRFYGGLYFAYDQALWLDAVSEALNRAIPSLRTIGYGAVLSTASEIVNTVGKQFAQPIRPRTKDGEIKSHLIRQMVRDRTISVSSSFDKWFARYLSVPRVNSHLVVRGDYKYVLQNHCSEVSVVYADPPYTRDHYSRFYHVLETLCLRDTPQITTTMLNGTGSISRGIYRNDRHQSPFCIKSQAPDAFRDLFSGVSSLDIPLICSYSPFVSNGHPRLMTVEAIVDLAKIYFDKVEVRFAEGVTHSKLNKSELEMETGKNAEVFIVCR